MAVRGNLKAEAAVTATATGAIIDPPVARNAALVMLNSIDATDRLREVDEAYAQVIAASMRDRAVRGLPPQLQPIEIVARPDGRWRLVFGAHRYRAVQINDGETIEAFIVTGDEAELRLREIDENLIRRELTALDRARFLLERKRIYEALNPGAKRGGDRRSDQSANMAVWSFAADIAEKTGLSERTVQRACALAETLSPDVVRRLQHHPLASNQAALETLAKQPAARQLAAVDLMLAEDAPAKSVAEAFNRLDGKVAKPAEELKVAKAVDLWGRMGAKERREFLAFLSGAELPKGCTVEVAQ